MISPVKGRLFSRAHARRALESSLAALVSHRYLTDGANLYRFVGWGARREFAELEDCRTLELLVVSVRELLGQRLRPVAAAEG